MLLGGRGPGKRGSCYANAPWRICFEGCVPNAVFLRDSVKTPSPQCVLRSRWRRRTLFQPGAAMPWLFLRPWKSLPRGGCPGALICRLSGSGRWCLRRPLLWAAFCHTHGERAFSKDHHLFFLPGQDTRLVHTHRLACTLCLCVCVLSASDGPSGVALLDPEPTRPPRRILCRESSA